MPKKSFKILRFDGGINQGMSPQDIGDNECEYIEEMAVDILGKLTNGYTFHKQEWDDDTFQLTAKTGKCKNLIAISTDHMKFHDNTSTFSGVDTGPGQSYIIGEYFNEGITRQYLRMIGRNGDNGLWTIANGSPYCNQPVLSFFEGVLRCINGDTTQNDYDQHVWKGWTPSETYLGGNPAPSGAVSFVNNWEEELVSSEGHLGGAFQTFSSSTTTPGVCINAVIMPFKDGVTNMFNFDTGFAGNCWYNGVSSNDNIINQSLGASGVRWGFAMSHIEGNPGTGTWMPETSVSYKFHISTMYDNHTQESLPQAMGCVGNFRNATQNSMTLPDGNSLKVQSEISFHQREESDGIGAVVAGSAPHYTAQPGQNVSLELQPVINISHNGTYVFGAGSLGATSGGRRRISGIRVYWSSSEDAHSALWQMLDIDFRKGIKFIGADGSGGGTQGFTPFDEATTYAPGFRHVTSEGDGFTKWTNPPRYFQYSVLNGHEPTDSISVQAYKAYCFANRRLYIGNVLKDGQIHSDRMLKSPVNQFDKFPSINNIDVAIEDGDEIVELVEFADRILQFKQNKIYVINISGNTEFLETEINNNGVLFSHQVCKFSGGVAWISQHGGIYLYNGQSVESLHIKNGQTYIREEWLKHVFFNRDGEVSDKGPQIGYEPHHNCLVISSNGEGLVNDAEFLCLFYHFNTKAFTKSAYAIWGGSNNKRFPLINLPKTGELVLVNEGDNDRIKSLSKVTGTYSPSWNTQYFYSLNNGNPAASSWVSKVIDFGEPAKRRKITGIYVTYSLKLGNVQTDAPMSYPGLYLALKYIDKNNSTEFQLESRDDSFVRVASLSGLEPYVYSLPATTTTTTSKMEQAFFKVGLKCKMVQLIVNNGDRANVFEISDITLTYRDKLLK